MKMKLTFLILIMGLCFYSNAQSNLTAEEILNKSIEFCGGMKNISKIKSSNLIYDLTVGDDSHASVIIKREISDKYMRSILSENHVPNSMHFDGISLIEINGETKRIINDLSTIEELKLQTYNLPQHGYKELAYSIKRLDDQKFSHFECYVISASAKNGYTTLNYFDKTNFRLLMIIYPKGNKSLLMEYVFRDSVLFNTKVVNVEENSEQITLVLKKLDNNININPLWFSIDKAISTSVPDNIRKGTFIASDNTLVNRTDTIQTELNGNLNPKLFLSWFNNYAYIMVDSKSINKQAPLQTGDNILVKIVSWDNNGYVCHYYSNGVSGTQEYKMKK